jgi:hypothetical protein
VPYTTIRVSGLKELQAAIRTAGGSKLGTALKLANEAAGETVVDKALPRVPFRRGALRRSVRSTATERSAKAKAGDGGVAYAGAIHWGRKIGNVGSPPGNRRGRNPIRRNAFLWDAARDARPALVRDYEKAIDQIVVAHINRPTG